MSLKRWALIRCHCILMARSPVGELNSVPWDERNHMPLCMKSPLCNLTCRTCQLTFELQPYHSHMWPCQVLIPPIKGRFQHSLNQISSPGNDKFSNLNSRHLSDTFCRMSKLRLILLCDSHLVTSPHLPPLFWEAVKMTPPWGSWTQPRLYYTCRL